MRRSPQGHRQPGGRARPRQFDGGASRNRQHDQSTTISRAVVGCRGHLCHSDSSRHHPGRRLLAPPADWRIRHRDHIEPISRPEQPDRLPIRDAHGRRDHLDGARGWPRPGRDRGGVAGIAVLPARTRDRQGRRHQRKARGEPLPPPTAKGPPQPMCPAPDPQGSKLRNPMRLRNGRGRKRGTAPDRPFRHVRWSQGMRLACRLTAARTGAPHGPRHRGRWRRASHRGSGSGRGSGTGHTRSRGGRRLLVDRRGWGN